MGFNSGLKGLIHWCDVQGQGITMKVTDSENSSAAAACMVFD
jgi:uncharacterized protein YlxW (UPF0749 family)